MGPVDYSPQNYVSPVQSLRQGFQTGFEMSQGIRAIRQANQIQEQDERIVELYEKIYNRTATPEDYQVLSALLPEEQAKTVRESLALMDTQMKEQEVAELAPIFSALHSGATSVGRDLLRERAEAYSNSGATEEAQIYSALADLADSGPDGAAAVESYIGYMMTELPGGTDIMEGAKTYWEIEKLKAEIAEMAATADTLDAETLFNMEKKIRDEYAGRTRALDDARLDYDKLRESAGAATGAGDVALVFSFMRMLDPGSVVRESEFAQARDTTGLRGRLEVLWERLKAGESLTPEQRANFLRLAGQYMEAAEAHAIRVREDLEAVVDNYGLNPENIFGITPEERADREMANLDLNALRNFIKRNNPNTRLDIDNMDVRALRDNFPNGYRAFIDRQASTQPQQTVEEVDL